MESEAASGDCIEIKIWVHGHVDLVEAAWNYPVDWFVNATKFEYEDLAICRFEYCSTRADVDVQLEEVYC